MAVLRTYDTAAIRVGARARTRKRALVTAVEILARIGGSQYRDGSGGTDH
jgi:hypothetical protein